MKTINHTLAEIPLDQSWDVIVVGGGPAGCGAALAAARGGARTLLVESSGAMGGMMTNGLVTVWAPFSDDSGTQTGHCYYGGLALEVMTECKKGMPHVPPEKMDWVPVDPERIKRIYDRRLSEAGVTVLFETVLGDVVCEGGDPRRVRYVLLANKAGFSAYGAKVVIDGTGDGDVAVKAGASFEQGEGGEREQVQPVSLCFAICNIDDYAMTHGPYLGPWNPKAPIFDILKSGRYPEIRDSHFCYTQIGPGTYTFNAGHVWDIDGTNPAAVSRAMMEGRRLAEVFLRALKEFCPAAFANAFLVATAPRLGVRETRRVIGEYVLTVEDYLTRRSFPDDVAQNHYWIDIHTAKSEIANAQATCDHVTGRFERFKNGESHGIPYRCLVPKGLTNVLVAGRAISCDRPVQGAIRVMPCAMNLGEAAGTAAAQMVATGLVDSREVSIPRLRAELLRHGAYLPGAAEAAPAGAKVP